jgi:hypothetical protein
VEESAPLSRSLSQLREFEHVSDCQMFTVFVMAAMSTVYWPG